MVSFHPNQVLLQRGNLQRASAGVAAFSGVLDEHESFKAAWSLYRRLVGSYTGPLARVRRDGDDAEMDLNPQPDGTLDTAALGAWCMAGGSYGYGYVVKLYDQSGAGLHLEQTSAGAQMMLVDQGNVVTIANTGTPIPAMCPVDGTQLYVGVTFSPAYTGEDVVVLTHQQMTNTADVWNSISVTHDTSNNWDSSERGVLFSMSSGNFSAVRAGVLSAGFTATNEALLVTARFGAGGWEFDLGGSGGGDSDASMQGNFNVNRFLLAALNTSSAYGGTSCRFSEAVVYLANITPTEVSQIRTAMALSL